MDAFKPDTYLMDISSSTKIQPGKLFGAQNHTVKHFFKETRDNEMFLVNVNWIFYEKV